MNRHAEVSTRCQKASKWIDQIHATDSVATAARITLKSRLEATAHFLRLAADHADETTEHVHQFRVSTRRSLAALRIYDELLLPREAKWFRKRMHRLRKAAGDARDLDVMRQRYKKKNCRDREELLCRVGKRRRKAQRPIEKLSAKLIAGGLYETHVDRLLKSIAAGSTNVDQPLNQWAKSRLDKVAAKFFRSIPRDLCDVQSLHRFRVRGKDLRYVMELFSTLFPPDLRRTLYPWVTQVQDRLGEVTDHAAARDRLAKWGKRARGERRRAYLFALSEQEGVQLESSIERFRNWWTPEMATRMEASLRAMMQGSEC